MKNYIADEIQELNKYSNAYIESIVIYLKDKKMYEVVSEIDVLNFINDIKNERI